MSQENLITVRGYVTAEPKFWQTASTGTPVAEVRVGSTPRRLNRATGEWQDADTTYYTVKCWRRLAVNVASSLRKGDMVIVRGKFISRQWLDDQQRPRVQIEVEADTMGHDLMFGWAHFIRGVQAPRAQAGQAGDDEMGRREPAAFPPALDGPVDAASREDPDGQGDRYYYQGETDEMGSGTRDEGAAPDPEADAALLAGSTEAPAEVAPVG